MTSYATKLADIIVPEIFAPYMQLRSEQKSRLIASGAVARDTRIDQKLAGGGLTFNTPSWKDLNDDSENVDSDDDEAFSTPKKHGAIKEVAVRLSRNQSWSDMDLDAAIAGADPMSSIAELVSSYWAKRQQAAFLATLMGVFRDNDAAPSGSEHTQYDLTFDASSSSYVAGVTNFTTEGFIDTCTLMGDSMEGLGLVLMHSVVYARLLKNNLIDFIPDSEGKTTVPTYLGRAVIVDDQVPNPAGVANITATTTGIYHTILVGAGAFRLGVGSPSVPAEVIRVPSAGSGAGQETMHSRVQWCIHPVGHKYAGTPASGGPSNASTTNNLANAGSWQRAWTERKQVKIARLITREF